VVRNYSAKRRQKTAEAEKPTDSEEGLFNGAGKRSKEKYRK
jgi:hypothetical protein